MNSVNTSPTVTIGLLWHSTTSDNLGVGALTQSQIAICTAAAERAGVTLKFIVFGTQGGQNYSPSDTEIVQGSRISLRQIATGRSPFITELSTCDVVLDIGEGDSFTDIYGFKRLLFLLVSKLFVLWKRIPLVISPQTIGPFKYGLNREVAAAVLRRSTRVFARDYLSADYLGAIGVLKNTSEVVDVAFRLPFIRPIKYPDGKRHIGINVSGLLFSGGYAGSNQFGLTLDYPTLIRKLIKNWGADDHNVIWLIAHVIPDGLPRDDDRIANATLAKEFPNVRLAPSFSSPEEAKSFIAGMDFLTGARMHACIAALSVGVAVAPVAYSRKFNGLFTSLNYPFFADAKVHSTQQAYDLICDALVRNGELSERAVKSQAQALIALSEYESYLRKLCITPHEMC
jgi:polysaccharide pyruvyl transferase WcaK-like protein